MSITARYRFDCDGYQGASSCQAGAEIGERCPPFARPGTVLEAWREVLSHGWSSRDGRHFCPDCTLSGRVPDDWHAGRPVRDVAAL